MKIYVYILKPHSETHHNSYILFILNIYIIILVYIINIKLILILLHIRINN